MSDPLHPEAGVGMPVPPRPSPRTKLWLIFAVLAVVGSIVGTVVLGALWLGKSVTDRLTRVAPASAPAATPRVVPRPPSATPVPIVSTNAVAATASSQAVLRIVSTTPASPAALKLGERMSVAIRYENPGPGWVQIWARPWTGGKITRGYGAHGSSGYPPGKGQVEGWFTFRAPTEVDEVRVEMVNVDDRKVVATARLAVRGAWSGEALVEPVAKTPATKPPTDSLLYRDGAFGFPQKDAKVLCDSGALRFSVWNNSEYLFAQAIMWGDSDAGLGTTNDGRAIGDGSYLRFDFGGEFLPSPHADRSYSLNPWPNLPGLRYSARMSQVGWTPIKSDSKGRGAIRYEAIPGRDKARVDTFAIPLSELSKAPGDGIRLAYLGRSQKPPLTLNSTDFVLAAGTTSIPANRYHPYTLVPGHEFDVNRIPDGQKDTPAVATTPKPVRVASGPAEGETLDIKFTAMDGREVDLAKMKGKVVLIDFWATWCGPCIAELPHVLDAYRKFHGKGFEIVGISFDSDRAKLERMVSEKQMTWPQFFDGLGWKNEFGQRYGIRGIPTMWLVNKEGKLASKNARSNLAGQVEKLLAE